MERKLTIKWIISYVLMCLVTVSFGQGEKKNPIGEYLYQEYKKKGIDHALQQYERSKSGEKDLYLWDEWQLNNLGYKLMQEDRDLAAAEKIFRLNMEEYPMAANPVDSYGDFLMESGNPEEAIKYFQQSVDMAEGMPAGPEKTQVLRASKAKLAKLENKHRQLEFLVGEWEMETVGFNDGQEAMRNKSFSNINYLPGEAVLAVNHLDAQNKPCCQRSMVYDAMDDQYHMVYMSAGEPRGIETSTMKIKSLGNNKYELLESYVDDDGLIKAARHEMVKNMDDSLQWTIFEPTDNNQWSKVNEMTFRKKM